MTMACKTSLLLLHNINALLLALIYRRKRTYEATKEKKRSEADLGLLQHPRRSAV